MLDSSYVETLLKITNTETSIWNTNNPPAAAADRSEQDIRNGKFEGESNRSNTYNKTTHLHFDHAIEQAIVSPSFD